jgi:hypothetical protein
LRETVLGKDKTTTEELSLPYRNGILHGRDLGFANKVVAAKCWAALFAIRDWADAIKKGKKQAPPEEPKLTFKESLIQLQDTLNKSIESKRRNDAVSKLVENWRARDIEIGIHVPAKGNSKEYKDYTPEQAAILFVENWMNNNYGAIANQIHYFSNKPTNMNSEAGRIRKVFGTTKLLDYRIINVKDFVPAISEVTLELALEVQNKNRNLELTLRLIYEDDEGQLMVHGEIGGCWKFMEHFFYKIEQLPYL